MPEPSLSVLLATPDDFQTLREVVRALARQTIADRIELAIALEDPSRLGAPEGAFDAFHGVRLVAHPVAGLLSEARAAAARACTAPFIALGEDHCLPRPRWAEALLDAHARGYRLAGPVMSNPNGRCRIAWADAIINFGSFLHPARGGEMPFLAGHNTSYERGLLLRQDQRLADILQIEAAWHFELAAEGERMWLEKEAVVDHWNLATPGTWLSHKLLGGMIFGAARSTRWPLWKRLAGGLMSPVVPPLRLWRMRGRLAELHRAHGILPGVLPWLLLGLLVHGAGEAWGTVVGECGARSRYWSAEFHRKGAPWVE